MVKSASIPQTALARPFPDKITFWSPPLPVLLILLAPDLRLFSERSFWAGDPSCAMAAIGEFGSGTRFHVRSIAYSPISGGVKRIRVRCGIVVSASVATIPEGPLTSANRTPETIRNITRYSLLLCIEKSIFTWSSVDRVEIDFLFFANRKRQLIFTIHKRLPSTNDSHFPRVDYPRVKRRSRDIGAVPQHADVEDADFLRCVRDTKQPDALRCNIALAYAVRTVNLQRKAAFNIFFELGLTCQVT